MIPSASCVQIRRDGLTASHPKWRPKTKSVLQKPNSWTSQSPSGPQPHHTILLYSTMNDLLSIHESTASGQNSLTWYQEASASWPLFSSASFLQRPLYLGPADRLAVPWSYMNASDSMLWLILFALQKLLFPFTFTFCLSLLICGTAQVLFPSL